MTTNDSTSPLVSRQPSLYPAPYLVPAKNIITAGTCETAKTYVGQIVETEDYLVCAVTCKRWGCRFCASQKIKRLAILCKLAAPNRLLTLTVDPKNYTSPRHAFDATAALVPELIRSLRKRFGEVEYLRVTELHKSGYPHYHMLVRSGFLPHAVVKALWDKLTNNTIVDLRQVDGTFQSYTYLTKYLSKMHRLEWTDRHVSYSRNFFPEGSLAKKPAVDLANAKMYQMHPYYWLAEHCPGQEVVQLAPMTFKIVHQIPESVQMHADAYFA